VRGGKGPWQHYLTKGMVRPALMNMISWTICKKRRRTHVSRGVSFQEQKATNRGHCLNVARCVLPIDPGNIKTHRRNKPCDGHRAEAEVVPDHAWDLLLVRVPDGLASAVRLEQGRAHVSLHPLRAAGAVGGAVL
jgi:hypothetical protein